MAASGISIEEGGRRGGAGLSAGSSSRFEKLPSPTVVVVVRQQKGGLLKIEARGSS